MKIQVPDIICQEIKKALHIAGEKEIGGILMGEHVAENTFCIRKITIQRNAGTIARFVREVKEIIIPLKKFFQKTKNNYKKYNYLGEWHSHPLFSLTPSHTDSVSMWNIVEDDQVGANFVILMIVHLHNNDLEASAYVYLPSGIKYSAVIEKSSYGE